MWVLSNRQTPALVFLKQFGRKCWVVLLPCSEEHSASLLVTINRLIWDGKVVRRKSLVILPKPKINWTIVTSIVRRAKCQYIKIQKLSSLISGAIFKEKGIELYDTGIYLVSNRTKYFKFTNTGSIVREFYPWTIHSFWFFLISLCKLMFNANLKRVKHRLGLWQ